MWLLIDDNIHRPYVERYVVFEAAADCFKELKARGWENQMGLGFDSAEGLKKATAKGHMCVYACGDVDLKVMQVKPTKCAICKHGTPMENALLPCDH